MKDGYYDAWAAHTFWTDIPEIKGVSNEIGNVRYS